MNEHKQCLQRDTTEGRCLEEGCGKNMLGDCMFLCRMVSTMQWSRPRNECQHRKSVTQKCCSSQVSPCVGQHVACGT